MKDSYSFDRDEEGLERSFRAHEAAYHRIFDRCGLEYYAVQAESGMMGGSESVDFLAPSGSGENTLVTCAQRRLRRRPRGRARACRARRSSRRRSPAPEEVETPGITTLRGPRASFLGIDLAGDLEGDAGRRARTARVVLALVRGDDRLEPAKLAAALGAAVAPVDRGGDPRGLRRRARLARPGRLPGRDRRRRDAARGAVRRRREPHRLAPARRRGRAATTRRGSPTSACRSRATAASRCGGELEFQTAIEVGHIFKLGTRYSVPLEATFLDEDGSEKPLVMGSYGIGLGAGDGGRGRAAPRRGRHPLAARRSRPYDVHVVALPGVEEQAEEAAEALARGGRRRAARRPRPARRREVRRRRPDRAPAAGDGRARRRSRTGWSTCEDASTGADRRVGDGRAEQGGACDGETA